MRMCVMKAPKVETPPAPPKVEQLDATQNMVAARENDMKRRRLAMSRASTRGGGSMQGTEAGKTKLGQ